MPARARKDIVREGEVACYHVWSRCVQRIWLCGEDPQTGVDYSHRKEWMEKLLKYQTAVFAVDLGAYHLLSNHLHLNPCTRPDLAATWSHEEIAWRWKMAWPQWEAGQWFREPTDQAVEEVLAKGPEHLEKLRANLSSLSWYVARCKEPIARLSNAEAGTSGHMWAERFGCRELTDDGELLVGLIYTDLQQVKCGAANSLEESRHSSIQQRIRAWAVEQSQEIVEAFQRMRLSEGDDDLPPELVEQMLVDSWLTPFSDESPLLLMRKERAGDETGEAAAITLEALADTAGEAKKATPLSNCERKTFTLHRQLVAKLDDLTTRRPLLEMPRFQYLEIVRQAAEAWKQSPAAADDGLIDPRQPPRLSADGTIGSWRASLKQFRAFLHGAAPNIPLLRSVLARGDPASSALNG